jgi:hypothetical protein
MFERSYFKLKMIRTSWLERLDVERRRMTELPISQSLLTSAATQIIAVAFAILALVFVSGCVTKVTADAEAKAAFIAGQRAAYQSMQSNTTDVMVLGKVQKHDIPWVDGMTLAQALATATYTGAHDPTDIILRRNSVQTELDPRQLLNGKDVPLHPGDVISVIGQ